MQGLFVDRIHFFKLLSLSDKPRLHQLKILLLLVVQDQILWLSHSFNPYGEIPSSKGKHPVLRTNTKPHQLIKHPHISYSVVSLAFRRFSCSTYRIGLRYLKAEAFQVPHSKHTNHASLIPFVGNLHFSIILHRVQYLKNLFMSWG